MVKISQAQATVGSIQGGIPPSRVNANPDYDDDDDLSLAALLWLVVLAMFTALFCLLSLLNFLHVDPLVFFGFHLLQNLFGRASRITSIHWPKGLTVADTQICLICTTSLKSLFVSMFLSLVTYNVLLFLFNFGILIRTFFINTKSSISAPPIMQTPYSELLHLLLNGALSSWCLVLPPGEIHVCLQWSLWSGNSAPAITSS